MSKQNIEIKAHYIQCDKEGCGHRTEITMHEAKNWVNRPCPECGSNLLTTEDHLHMLAFIGLVAIENSKPYVEDGKEHKQVLVNIHDRKVTKLPQ